MNLSYANYVIGPFPATKRMFMNYPHEIDIFVWCEIEEN